MDSQIPLISMNVRFSRLSRILSIQAVYALNVLYPVTLHGDEIGQVLYDVMHVGMFYLPKVVDTVQDINWLLPVVKEVISTQNNLDSYLLKYLTENWKIERVAKTLLAILRVGIYEIIKDTDIHLGAMIHDYLEITKMFNHYQEVCFVNSILDKAAKEIKCLHNLTTFE
ncbi:putative Transcription antitermination protein NusB [Alphaproteobacteria bacterium]